MRAIFSAVRRPIQNRERQRPGHRLDLNHLRKPERRERGMFVRPQSGRLIIAQHFSAG